MIPTSRHSSWWRPTSWVMAGAVALTLSGLALRPDAQAQTGKPVQPPVVQDVMVPGVGGLEQVALINTEIEKVWTKNKLQPAERCDDFTFLRRVTLDIAGRIPKMSEIDQFFADKENIRRSKLIERLLEKNDYPNNFANIWTTLLMTRSAGKTYREQMHLYLYDELARKDADWSKVVTELLTATGKTNENGAVNFILAHLGEEFKKDTGEQGHFDMVPITSRTTKLFLGLQTQCTQCHDHPLGEKWKQEDFWSINAFFRQVDAPKGRPMQMGKKDKMGGGQFTLVDNDQLNTTGMVLFENRKAKMGYAKAKFLDGTKIPQKITKTRRQVLAEFIVQSPYFGKAFVNRMWGHFFGVSFTMNGVADFSSTNTVSHPQLLEQLAKDWTTKYKHNPKDLVRWICNSKAYGLSAVANKTNTAPESAKYFSRMLLKPMSPEQLFESLTLATQPQLVLNSKDQMEKKEEWLNKLVVNFGNDEGEEATFNGTVVQALEMMNGKDINEAIANPKGAVELTIALNEGVAGAKYNLNHQKVITDLYKSALCRIPTKKEVEKILEPKMYLLPGTASPFTMAAKEARAFWKSYYEDVLWGLVNSSEFYLNH